LIVEEIGVVDGEKWPGIDRSTVIPGAIVDKLPTLDDQPIIIFNGATIIESGDIIDKVCCADRGRQIAINCAALITCLVADKL